MHKLFESYHKLQISTRQSIWWLMTLIANLVVKDANPILEKIIVYSAYSFNLCVRLHWDQISMFKFCKALNIFIFNHQVCKAIMEDEHEYHNHMRTHTNIHQCAICHTVFKKRDTIINHLKWHEKMKKISQVLQCLF